MNEFEQLAISESKHTIGDLCRVCGVTRRMVLNYEAHGLLQPIWVNKESGFRYYGAQSVARIQHIRALQKLGISLEKIGQFLNGDETAMCKHLIRLKELRDELDMQISRTEALLTPVDHFSVRREVFPGGDYALTSERCETSQDRFMLLWRFTAHVLDRGWPVASRGCGLISVLHTNPGGEKYGLTSAAWALTEPNEESVYFAPCEVLSVNVKGPYTQLPKGIAALRTYAAEHDLPVDGDLRFAYLTSPQSHTEPEHYVTQIFLEL